MFFAWQMLLKIKNCEKSSCCKNDQWFKKKHVKYHEIIFLYDYNLSEKSVSSGVFASRHDGNAITIDLEVAGTLQDLNLGDLHAYVKNRWFSMKINKCLIGAKENMGVSKNKGTPKWMVKIMENPIKMDDLGVHLFLETSICLLQIVTVECISVLYHDIQQTCVASYTCLDGVDTFLHFLRSK